jgi:hypothetical protein
MYYLIIYGHENMVPHPEKRAKIDNFWELDTGGENLIRGRN